MNNSDTTTSKSAYSEETAVSQDEELWSAAILSQFLLCFSHYVDPDEKVKIDGKDDSKKSLYEKKRNRLFFSLTKWHFDPETIEDKLGSLTNMDNLPESIQRFCDEYKEAGLPVSISNGILFEILDCLFVEIDLAYRLRLLSTLKTICGAFYPSNFYGIVNEAMSIYCIATNRQQIDLTCDHTCYGSFIEREQLIGSQVSNKPNREEYVMYYTEEAKTAVIESITEEQTFEPLPIDFEKYHITDECKKFFCEYIYHRLRKIRSLKGEYYNKFEKVKVKEEWGVFNFRADKENPEEFATCLTLDNWYSMCGIGEKPKRIRVADTKFLSYFLDALEFTVKKKEAFEKSALKLFVKSGGKEHGIKKLYRDSSKLDEDDAKHIQWVYQTIIKEAIEYAKRKQGELSSI